MVRRLQARVPARSLSAALTFGLLLLVGCTGGAGEDTHAHHDGEAASTGGATEAPVPASGHSSGTDPEHAIHAEAACETLVRAGQTRLPPGPLDQDDLPVVEAVNLELGDLLVELASQIRSAAVSPLDDKLADNLEDAAATLQHMAEIASAFRSAGVQPDEAESVDILRRLDWLDAAMTDLEHWERESCHADIRLTEGEINGIPWLHIEMDDERLLPDHGWSDGWGDTPLSGEVASEGG